MTNVSRLPINCPPLTPIYKPLQVVKTFGHDLGLSCSFRQWKATHSHCHFIHGYAIGVKLTFAAIEPDERGWVIDFGSFSTIRDRLRDMFDHRLLVAADDPELPLFQSMHDAGVADIFIVPATGCEAFARIIFADVQEYLQALKQTRVWLVSVEVMEHGANAAICNG